MDSSAVSEEEERREPSKEAETSPGGSAEAAGEVLAGKRAKKSVERLDFQAPKQKEKLQIGDGSGDKLGDIPRTNHLITRMKPADLKPLHAILFDRPGKMASIKKNLRLFNGFPFHADSDRYGRKRDKLLRSSNFTNTKLKEVCAVLDLEKKGTHSDLVDRILTFLLRPKNSGKRLPVKKRRKSKKKLSGDDSRTKTRRPNPRSSSSPKKSKSGSKSNAIVMDSSSEEEDKAGASAEAEESDTQEKPSEEEEESSTRRSGGARRTKRPRAPAKKSGPQKRARREASDGSDGDERPTNRKPAAVKVAAESQKADSSSRSHAHTGGADSSDEDEPLIRMIRRSPTEQQLRDTVQGLLREANLEEMTMKQICQRVFDTYPEHDLTAKKDFIKQTVKSLIT